MLKLIYVQKTWKEVWSDDEMTVEGHDCISGGISEALFSDKKELDNFIENASVSAGESEGHETFEWIVAYDLNSGWYQVNK